jgi:hypothetical protein
MLLELEVVLVVRELDGEEVEAAEELVADDIEEDVVPLEVIAEVDEIADEDDETVLVEGAVVVVEDVVAFGSKNRAEPAIITIMTITTAIKAALAIPVRWFENRPTFLPLVPFEKYTSVSRPIKECISLPQFFRIE